MYNGKTKSAIADHFGVYIDDVKHNPDGYPDEFFLFDKKIEVVTLGSAIRNNYEQRNNKIDELCKDVSENMIGPYTRMNDNYHYFRWM